MIGASRALQEGIAADAGPTREQTEKQNKYKPQGPTLSVVRSFKLPKTSPEKKIFPVAIQSGCPHAPLLNIRRHRWLHVYADKRDGWDDERCSYKERIVEFASA